MTSETITRTITDWTEDPKQARSAPTVTARSQNGQAVLEAGPFTWRVDLPAPLGGTNQAPSPTALLLGALAGCAVVFVKNTLGPQLGVQIDGVEASVTCQTDARGLLGLDGADPDLQNVAVEVSVKTPDGEEAVARLAHVWEKRCPIYLALLKANDVDLTFRLE